MSTVGCFGKLPSQGDFLRVNAASQVARDMDVWVAEGIEVLQRQGAALPADPVYFVFRSEAAREALVGALVPSVDAVGRVFPLVIFSVVKATEVAGRFSEVPVAYSQFLLAAGQILAGVRGLTGPQVAEHLRGLPVVGPAEWSAAREICRRTSAGTSARDVQEQLFGDLDFGHQYYAFQTFLHACGPLRGRDPGKAGITLDCPVARDVHLYTWLEMARRLLNWAGAPPAFFWCERGYPRLLLSLGPAPPATLLYLARPEMSFQKLWPLSTRMFDAIEQAKRNLPSRYRSAIDGPAVALEGLLAALAG